MKWAKAAALVLIVGFAVGAAPNDSAVIVNSGSTNTIGYRIEVQSDGTATVAVQQNRTATPGPAKAFNVPAATAKKFFDDLAAARKGNAAMVPCMKSASFGSTITVTWQGWKSGDLTCPPKDDLGQALISDVNQIQVLSGVNTNEVRPVP